MKPDFCLDLRDGLFYNYTDRKGKQSKTLESGRAIFKHMVSHSVSDLQSLSLFIQIL